MNSRACSRLETQSLERSTNCPACSPTTRDAETSSSASPAGARRPIRLPRVEFDVLVDGAQAMPHSRVDVQALFGLAAEQLAFESVQLLFYSGEIGAQLRVLTL